MKWSWDQHAKSACKSYRGLRCRERTLLLVIARSWAELERNSWIQDPSKFSMGFPKKQNPRLFDRRSCQDRVRKHTTSIQGDSLHPLSDPEQKRGKSQQDLGVQICRGSGKEMLDILEKIRALFLAMILADFLNESWQDPLSFFRARILNCFRKTLQRILNDPDEILKAEITKILIRIVSKSYSDLVESGSLLNLSGFLKEWSGMRLG